MIQFQLFRLKVYPSQQANLFEVSKSRSEILKDSILALPSAELREGAIWHIGNVTNIDPAGFYFRIGRMSKLKIEIYENGNFKDQEFETAPYTHVILDNVLELCAIAKKTRLSPTINGISKQLVRLLNKTENASKTGTLFEINEVADPEDFITHIKQAYSISKFWVRFSKPNSFDVNRDFIKPMQKMLDESNGEKGKTELEGTNLNPHSLEAIARSAATSGDDAGACFQIEQTGNKVRKRLRGNPINVSQINLDDDEQKLAFLRRIRETYQKIRGHNAIEE